MAEATWELLSTVETYSDNIMPDEGNTENHSGNVSSGLPPASTGAVATLSIIFCAVGIVGLVGNFLVMWVVLTDRKMRNSVTNIFITNLALADFLIMLFGIPEIIQFMINKGWLLGETACKTDRYILVLSLYVSIMSLVSVCVERYVAIVHPIKAHILCSKKRILIAVGFIWPVALLIGLPTLLFNTVKKPHVQFPVELCFLSFPANHVRNYMIYKFSESAVFFLGPVVIQAVMYTVICKRLFVGTKELHRKQNVRTGNGNQKEKDSDAIKARKGVVKMLIASVLVYFISYAPTQVPLFYNVISPVPFSQKWSFLVLVMTLGYVNSAANPILYMIFSQKFRQKFFYVLVSCLGLRERYMKLRKPPASEFSGLGESQFTSRTRFIGGRNTQTSALISEC